MLFITEHKHNTYDNWQRAILRSLQQNRTQHLRSLVEGDITLSPTEHKHNTYDNRYRAILRSLQQNTNTTLTIAGRGRYYFLCNRIRAQHSSCSRGIPRSIQLNSNPTLIPFTSGIPNSNTNTQPKHLLPLQREYYALYNRTQTQHLQLVKGNTTHCTTELNPNTHCPYMGNTTLYTTELKPYTYHSNTQTQHLFPLQVEYNALYNRTQIQHLSLVKRNTTLCTTEYKTKDLLLLAGLGGGGVGGWGGVVVAVFCR